MHDKAVLEFYSVGQSQILTLHALPPHDTTLTPTFQNPKPYLDPMLS